MKICDRDGKPAVSTVTFSNFDAGNAYDETYDICADCRTYLLNYINTPPIPHCGAPQQDPPRKEKPGPKSQKKEYPQGRLKVDDDNGPIDDEDWETA